MNSRLLEGICKNVELTREDVKKLADRITTGVSGPSDRLGETQAEIPLNPQREHFKHITHWDPTDWRIISRMNSANSPKTSDSDKIDPKISLYMEDQYGNPIPPEIKTALRHEVHAYWNDLYWDGSSDLRNYGNVGLRRKDDFRKTFEDRYPWLRLCSGHWKVDQLWMSYFHSWKQPKYPRPTSDQDTKELTPGENVKELTPDSTTATMATSPPPLGSKRRLEEHEDSTDESYRRQKRKEDNLILMAPTVFHHSRPPAKTKVPLRKAKVRLPSFPYLA